MSIIQAIRIVTPKSSKSRTTTLVHLFCHVKPGARDGEANKAVREVVAEALKVPKSDVHIAKGMKSREKTVEVVITDHDNKETKSQEEEIQRIKNLLLLLTKE
ncbi:uncharacterized protein EI97DRAFT_459791 [Westerdykella ornata]|uniref:DUF167-domain-containing protein n=1 Tax=Westerdykella ornata TaxID=318751 RepID=A0A6A6JE32_WESOR|nr:uncharacterized protein EI97DRAFT_459791 [Westerdykella ornata]KAF2274821.1 hypothetical protein EI97DRAFT_459791 [Westerdykella ornata]